MTMTPELDLLFLSAPANPVFGALKCAVTKLHTRKTRASVITSGALRSSPEDLTPAEAIWAYQFTPHDGWRFMIPSARAFQ